MTSRAQRLFSSLLFLVVAAQCSGTVSAPPAPPGTGGAGEGGASGAGPGPGSGGTPGGSGGSGGQTPPGRGGAGGSAGAGTGGSAGAGGAGGAAGRDAGGGGGATAGRGGGGSGGAAGRDAGGTSPPPTNDAGTVGSMPAGPAGPWARGLQIGVVEVSQATFIRLGEGGQVVAPTARNAPIIEGRPLLVRVFVTPGAGFSARRLRGVVSIEAGGATKAFEEAKMISGASDSERAETTFNVLVPAAEMKPGAALWAAVYEAGPAAGDDPATPPRFPATGATDLAVKGGRMVLDVVAVPVTGPGGPLTDTPERRRNLENHLYDLYPVQKVNLKFRAPVTVDARITERTAAFGLIRDARTADGASARPYEYYHLLVAREDTTFTFAGTAGGGGGSANDPGSRRVSLTLVGGRAVDGNTNTVAHELGHNHGESHVPACGASGGSGSMYPLPEGALPTSGWSFSENALKTKARFKELMGYCRPRWISDFMWKRFEIRVRMVSALPVSEPPVTAFPERSLLGYVAPGERPNWGVVPERLVDASTISMSAQRIARLVMDDGRILYAPVSVNVMSDDVTREIAVNLPPDAPTGRAEVTVDGERFTISVGDLATP
jgi:hypothetical protein